MRKHIPSSGTLSFQIHKVGLLFDQASRTGMTTPIIRRKNLKLREIN